MAAKKKKKTKYARSSKRDVESEMRRYKKGTAKSGRGGKGGRRLLTTNDSLVPA